MSKHGLDMIRESDVFMVLVTKHYLQDLRNHDTRITLQIEHAKLLGKPTVLIISEDLTEKEQEEATSYFQEHKLIGKVFFNRRVKKSLKEAVEKVKEIYEKHKETM